MATQFDFTRWLHKKTDPEKETEKKTETHCYTIWNTVFEIDTKYQIIRGLGRGGYGAVCSASNRESNEMVAIKKISNVFSSQMVAIRTLREMKLLRILSHKNIIVLKDIMLPSHTSFNEVYLVFELMDTDLCAIINSSQPLTAHKIHYLFFQLVLGVKYMHSANVIHRDLKPGNLLVNANSQLKICDLGMARRLAQTMSARYVGTPCYLAPELLLNSNSYGTAVDVWSVGCILAELLGRKPIFQGSSVQDQLKHIFRVIGSLSQADLDLIDDPNTREYIKTYFPPTPPIPFARLYPTADPWAIDLLHKMLVFTPSKRISMSDALLDHPYLSCYFEFWASMPAWLNENLDVDSQMQHDEIRGMMRNELAHYRMQ